MRLASLAVSFVVRHAPLFPSRFGLTGRYPYFELSNLLTILSPTTLCRPDELFGFFIIGLTDDIIFR